MRELPLIWRFMIVPVVGALVALALVVSFLELRREGLGKLDDMRVNVQGRVQTIVQYGSQLAETYANIYQLLLDSSRFPGEAELYMEARPLLDALHAIEAGLERELGNVEAHTELAKEISHLVQILESTRVGSTNALLMVTVDFDLAAEQTRDVTRLISEANQQFLRVELLLHRSMNQQIERIGDQLQRRSQQFGTAFAVIFLMAFGVSVWLILRVVRDLRASVLALSRIARQEAAETRRAGSSNEIVLLERAIEDVGHGYEQLRTARETLEETNASLIESHDAVQEREKAVSRLNAELNDKVEKLNQAVDERREAELALSRSQRMEAIGNLTGGVAHDFNNILAIILGNLELLKGEGHPESGDKLIDTAIDATLRGADLTKNMLAFARRASLEPATLDLNAIVLRTKNWAGRTLPANIAVETSLLAGLWPIEADATSTENALLNLILNARDAMPEGGKLTIETANVRIDEDYIDSRGETIEPGRYAMLAVSDSGTGIPRDVLEKIFDPFFTTKPPGAGSGLGLSMIQGFMNQSGGTVRVYSEPGVGTTFKLYFQVAAAALEATSTPQAEARVERSMGGRVLIAEDEPQVLAVLVRTLSQAGYDVEAVASGDEALRTYRADPTFDLVVTDIVMPGALQGTDLAKELRRDWPDLPVVFMSGYASEATVHGNGLKPDDVRLMKPVRGVDLLKAVGNALALTQKSTESRQC